VYARSVIDIVGDAFYAPSPDLPNQLNRSGTSSPD
jgi:hypothetical protein